MKIYNYLDKLKQNIKNENIKKILFNKYYDIKDLYWNLLYTLGFGLAAGIGNAIPEAESLKNFILALGNGFLNNAKLGIFINLFFAKTVDLLGKTSYPRLYTNLFCAFVQALFLSWHYIIGTENPIQTMVLPILIGFVLVNYHVNTLKKNQ